MLTQVMVRLDIAVQPLHSYSVLPSEMYQKHRKMLIHWWKLFQIKERLFRHPFFSVSLSLWQSYDGSILLWRSRRQLALVGHNDRIRSKIYNKNRHKYQYIKNREFRQFSLNLSKFFFLISFYGLPGQDGKMTFSRWKSTWFCLILFHRLLHPYYQQHANAHQCCMNSYFICWL